MLASGHFAEPPWRHLTDRRRDVRRGLDEVPCAGTVVVRMEPDRVEVFPGAAFHDAVIRKWHGPLCRSA